MAKAAGLTPEEWLKNKYNKLNLEAWARDGLIDKQIWENIGIGKTTFYKWKKENANFANSLKKNKEIADIQVENALFKRATGYSYTETKTVDNGTLKVTTITKKEVSPDTTAQIFWLKNRRRDKWGEKQGDKTEGDDSQSVMFEIVAASDVRRNDDDNETTSD